MKNNAASIASASDMPLNHSIACGKHTISLAIEGLRAVSEALDARFEEAVELIISMKGRLIVTGMGKSGHIARKIAATFASTGTPAHFVHPAEANHGDMGMITQNDVVLMLSNSGETAELSEMIAYVKRFNIPLMALVRREKSMLVEIADIPVVLPAVPEASDINAPTTSTSMMLAYGDALAMAVLERRGFTAEDFSLLHPGGKLGKALIRVRELMHTGETLPIVSLQDSMRDVLLVMTRKAFGCAIVVNEQGELSGIITDGDLRRHLHQDLLSLHAADVMTINPITTTPHSLVVEVLHILNSRHITSLIALEDRQPIGLIHIHDCLRSGVA
jgi:arabinose-5-phosphate isomerase